MPNSKEAPWEADSSRYINVTDVLFAQITHEHLAELLDLPRSRIAHARLPHSSGGRRPPPAGWEKAALKLAKQRASELQRLARELERLG